jgi:hypothetical protein
MGQQHQANGPAAQLQRISSTKPMGQQHQAKGSAAQGRGPAAMSQRISSIQFWVMGYGLWVHNPKVNNRGRLGIMLFSEISLLCGFGL